MAYLQVLRDDTPEAFIYEILTGFHPRLVFPQ